MSPGPDTLIVTRAGVARYGFACGAVGVLLGLFLYGIAVSRASSATPACRAAVPADAPAPARPVAPRFAREWRA